jgi:hypothetical protein
MGGGLIKWVGSRGFGWEVSFSSGAGGSDREYYFAEHERDKNKSFLAVKPIVSQIHKMPASLQWQ